MVQMAGMITPKKWTRNQESDDHPKEIGQESDDHPKEMGQESDNHPKEMAQKTLK